MRKIILGALLLTSINLMADEIDCKDSLESRTDFINKSHKKNSASQKIYILKKIIEYNKEVRKNCEDEKILKEAKKINKNYKKLLEIEEQMILLNQTKRW